jgi:hypothetical protein
MNDDFDTARVVRTLRRILIPLAIVNVIVTGGVILLLRH